MASQLLKSSSAGFLHFKIDLFSRQFLGFVITGWEVVGARSDMKYKGSPMQWNKFARQCLQ
jgi:hypothetical protein